jgi:thiol-disulfide isomerase/thioredoxin
MKKVILSLILLVFAVITRAQTNSTTRRITLTETTVVKDSTGSQYPYVVWQKLLASGDYSVKPVDPRKDDTEFLLVKYTEQQKAARLSKMGRPMDSKFFTTGEAIKPFKIKDIDGKKIDVKDWAGKTVVLNFWFINCPPCRAEIPDLNKLALKYKDNPNVIFIAIALDESWEVADFMKKNPLAYHLVGDGRYYAKLFNINLYPTNVVIDKQGKVQLHYSGGYMNGPYWLDKTIQESDKITL